MRSSVVVPVLVAALASGCHTTGGKIFGTAAIASGVGSIYLMSGDGPRIENGMIVDDKDRTRQGAGLMFVALGATAAWFVSEYIFGSPFYGVGGGAGGIPPETQVVALPPADPVAVNEPAPSVEETAPPPVEQPPPPPPPPVVIVVPQPPQRPQRPHDEWREASWYFDSKAGKDLLYNRKNDVIGTLDSEGRVWNREGVHIGDVENAPNCDRRCKRERALEILVHVARM